MEEILRKMTVEDIAGVFCQNKMMLLNKLDTFLNYLHCCDDVDVFQMYKEQRTELLIALHKLRDYIETHDWPELYSSYFIYEIKAEQNGIVLKLSNVKNTQFNVKDEIVNKIVSTSFELIRIPVPTVSVDRIAELYWTGNEEVEHWVDVGEVRAAEKVDDEWRIPILAGANNIIMDSALYRWNSYLENLPEEFSFLNKYYSIRIVPDYRSKWFEVLQIGYGESCLSNYSVEEKEKLETILMAHPAIHLADEVIFHIA